MTLILMTTLAGGCNSLFYHPDDVLYATPDTYGIAFEPRSIPTEDGFRLASWVLKPQGLVKGTLLHFHGNAQNMTAHFLFVHWLTQAGYRVVVFDYRGYGQSAGTADRDGLVRDGRAMVRDVCTRPEFKDGPIIVFGQSLGGAVAVPALATVPDSCVKALILESTFASYRGMARTKLGAFWPTWPLQFPLSFLVSNGMNAVDHINQLKVPLLMIHGSRDPVVPNSQGRALFDAYNSGAKEWWEVPNGGHTPAFGDDTSPWKAKLVDWLAKFAAQGPELK